MTATKLRTSVITTVRFEIEHDGKASDKQDIYNFLAHHTSFRDAFEGKTDGEFTIVDVDVIEDDIEDMNYEENDDYDIPPHSD